MKRFLIIMYTYSYEMHFSKDPCSYLYYLSKYFGWKGSYAYFSNKELHNDEFEKYCDLIYLGSEIDYKRQKNIVAEYIRNDINKFDVVMLFNYGSTTYKTARIAKKYNKKIFVYCKLDMNKNGFRHFYDGSLLRKIKVIPELFKTRNIDLFTVENKSFYAVMKRMALFRNRIEYLPNCVSLYDAKMINLFNNNVKENIVITVSRLGDPIKNNEMLLDSICKLPDKLLMEWKFIFIGPYTDAFHHYYSSIDEKVRNRITLTGPIYDRNKLFNLLSKSKIFSLTSTSESFGIATIEAMYFGCYPVLTNYGSIVKDIIPNEKYGTVVREYNTDIYSAKIGSVMEHISTINPNKIHDYIETNFSYKKWTKRLNQYLCDAINRG